MATIENNQIILVTPEKPAVIGGKLF